MDFQTSRVWKDERNLVKKLYRNVTNTAQVRELIFSAKLPFVLLNPKLIVDQFQVSIAVTRALCNMKRNKMKTGSFPTEIIYCLKPSKDISEPLNHFSAQDGDTDVFIMGEKALWAKVGEQILGEEVNLDQLSTFTDIPLVKKVYQIEEKVLQRVGSSLLEEVLIPMVCNEFTPSCFAMWSSKPNGNKIRPLLNR
ncbi:EKC/KEOPS complex subunit TPRKB [Folsomia candida]|uniref:EKC/KEOPS complex subunit TPRKB n=1 Tax=Folsomia candida TaxID=158441 RepID=UPI000B8FE3EA|nr:EKC/KEOPS complex subunit TPRKB [Folsomia candida]